MEQEIKSQKGFIKTSLLVIIIGSVLLTTGAVFGGLYFKVSKLIGEAKQLTAQEKYQEANKKLMLAQASWFVDDLGIRKDTIKTELAENKKLFEEKSIYDEGIEKLSQGELQESIKVLSEMPNGSLYYQPAQIRIKEAENEILEGELVQEKKAKEIAQQKAETEAAKRAQEEAARKVAEAEARKEKEAREAQETEERKMSADNDGDGLTYREELNKGTSDYDSDSDDDGMPDNLDTHPAGGGRNIPQTFAWSYGGYNWTWTESIQEDWYDYYKAKPRSSPESIEYITSDDPFIKKISKRISEEAEKTPNVRKTWLAVSFVQNLPYVDDVYTGYDEYPKYPIETFFEKNGDCEDTSYLAASIIDAMDIGSVLILLPGHMAVGVWMDCDTFGTYYEFDGRCYYYVETTSKNWAEGEIPDEYRYTPATLIKIPSGETIGNINPQYIKPCLVSSDFSGYYYDGNNYYSDSRCNNLAYCIAYKGYYLNPQIKNKFYWDSGCSQEVTLGCYKSKNYIGKFYRSGQAWYYDSSCTQLYQSMDCDYPSYLNYSCWSETSYNSKQSTCTLYARLGYSQETIDNCYTELAQCRDDIDVYQRAKNEYDQCWDRKEY